MRGSSRARARGFTLVELLVYLSLVTVGLLLVGAVEMTAQRAADLQQALIEVQRHGDGFLARLRRDVESAQRISQQGNELLLTFSDGRQVRWTPGRREVLGGGGVVQAQDEYRGVKSWKVLLEPVQGHLRVTTTVQLEQQGREAKVARERTGSAVTRLEVSGE